VRGLHGRRRARCGSCSATGPPTERPNLIEGCSAIARRRACLAYVPQQVLQVRVELWPGVS
jgi:hypothetical protein